MRACMVSAGLALAWLGLASADVPADEPAPLAGPEVEQNGAPGESVTFGESAMRNQMLRVVRVRPATFTEVLQQVAASDDPKLQPTDARKAAVNAILVEYQQAVESYRLEHRAESRELRRVVREGRASVVEERGEDAESAPVDEADLAQPVRDAQQRLRDLQRGAPSFEPYKARVWQELTPDQQAAVRAELERRIAERYGLAMSDAEMEMMGGEDAESESAADPASRAERFDAALADVMSRIRELPEGQRWRLVQRLGEELDRLERAAAVAQPPDMDSVAVPE